MSSEILGPQMKMWPPHGPHQTTAARNAPAAKGKEGGREGKGMGDEGERGKGGEGGRERGKYDGREGLVCV